MRFAVSWESAETLAPKDLLDRNPMSMNLLAPRPVGVVMGVMALRGFTLSRERLQWAWVCE